MKRGWLAVILWLTVFLSAAAMADPGLCVGEQTLIRDTMFGTGMLYYVAEVSSEMESPGALDAERSMVLLTDDRGQEIACLPYPEMIPSVLMPGETGWLSIAVDLALFEDGDRIASARAVVYDVPAAGVPRRTAEAWIAPPYLSEDWMNLTDVVILSDGVRVPEGLNAAFAVYTPEGRPVYAWGGRLSGMGGYAEDNGQWTARASLPELVLIWCRAHGTVPDIVKAIVYEEN